MGSDADYTKEQDATVEIPTQNKTESPEFRRASDRYERAYVAYNANPTDERLGREVVAARDALVAVRMIENLQKAGK